MSELALDPPDATSDEAGPPLRDEDYLILSTIHSAKGQEWRSVFVLNCVDGCIPSDLATGSSEEIEEERRLLYVAMTRAKDELALIVSAALLCPRPAEIRRPQRVREPHPVSAPAAAQALRPPDLARSRARAAARAGRRPARRSSGADAGDVAVSRQSGHFAGVRSRCSGATRAAFSCALRSCSGSRPVSRGSSADGASDRGAAKEKAPRPLAPRADLVDGAIVG